MAKILETRGLEIESTTLTQRKLAELVREVAPGFASISHDASCESYAYNLSGMNVFNYPGDRGDVVGGEIVTRPFYDNEWPYVEKILLALKAEGESERTRRGSIHIHVGFPEYFPAIRKALSLIRATESLWFHLGGMGYEFRGQYNESIYCRPLTKSGPPVVPTTASTYVKLFQFDELLEARNAEHLWQIMMIDSRERYHPSRYFFINLYSIVLHGTVEFRVFNRSLAVNKVKAVADLCTHFCKAALFGSDQIDAMPTSSIFEPRNSFDILDEFLGVTKSFGTLNQKTVADIVNILETTPIPRLFSGNVLTHVQRFVLNSSENSKHEVFDYISPGNVDIHNIESIKKTQLEDMCAS